MELHEVGAGAGDRPVVVDETQVGAGAPAPIGLTRIGSWGRGRGEVRASCDLPAPTWPFSPGPTPLHPLSPSPFQHRQTLLHQQAGLSHISAQPLMLSRRPLSWRASAEAAGPLPMGCREGWYTCRSKGWVLVLCTTVTLWPVHLLALASVFVRQSVQYTSPPYSVTANGCDRNSCPRSTSMWPEPS